MDKILENAPCGFLSFSDDGEIRLVNNELCRLLGLSREEVVGIKFEKILTVPGRIFYQTHFFPLLKLRDRIEEIYLELKPSNGEVIPVLVNAVRRTHDGEVYNDCILVAMKNRNQYEEEILLAKKKAEQAALAKDEFLSIISHELRSPLNAILGWSQMMLDYDALPESIEKGLETISRNARVQTQLIGDLLDFSRIISGKLRLSIKKIDLAEVINNAVDVVLPAANAKKLKIETVLDSACEIDGDADRLQQVMWNLLTNSVKFTPKNGTVKIRLMRIDSTIEIVVKDSGEGIKREFIPYIFERFEQQDKSKARQHGGLGLGLAITYHIIQLHGGTIKAESPGKDLGAVFTISLPISAVRQIDKPIRINETNGRNMKKEKASPAESSRLSGLKVLIVDNEQDARELIGFILSREGAVISEAESVRVAVGKFDSFDPDLVISDIGMPGEDGFTLIERLKESDHARKKNTPAIALTGHASTADRVKILAMGYKIHLAKPVEPEELVAVAANFSDHRR